MYTYPFNPHGNNSTCNVVNEEHQLTRFNAQPYFFVIPKYAPFFACSINVTLNNVELVEGTDYNLIMPYVSATRSTGHPIYAGIAFNTNEGATAKISYMTLGGVWVNDTHDTWKILAEQTYNPRHVYYDQITSVPDIFPPTPHSVQHRDFNEFGTILTSMGHIAKAIAQKDTPSHIMDYLIDTRSNKFTMLEQQLAQANARIRVLENT